MKGHVPTPDSLADHMIRHLFDQKPPEPHDRVLYPGIGSNAPFVQAVERWCGDHDYPIPDGIGVELDPDRLTDARDHVSDHIEIHERDFLDSSIPDDLGEFKYIVGNPPYVPIEGLSEDEKEEYRTRFDTAIERFDLYLLFFERGLDLLVKNGRLTFVTPEKYEYVSTAAPLRKKMASRYHVRRLEHLSEDRFEEHITYPTVTTVDHSDHSPTVIRRRDGSEDEVTLPTDGSSWAPHIRETGDTLDSGVTLGDVCERISPGVATGRDGIFVMAQEECPPQLIEDGWARHTVSGSQLTRHGPDGPDVIITPYNDRGDLVSKDDLGTFGEWAKLHRSELEERSCVGRKPWYAFHETPPLSDMLTEKIMWMDVSETPEFWIDREAKVIPRHTVYYAIPEDPVDVDTLIEYLRSDKARAWIEANAQKAHNDYLRLQSSIMKDLPVPEEFGETIQQTLL